MGEAEEIGEAGTGNDAIVIDAAEALAEVGDKRELARRARGEVRVAAFRGGRHEASVDVVQERFAEAGAGRDKRGVARRHCDAFLQRRELVGLEHRHGVRHRFEIVQERNGAVEPLADRCGVGDPGHVDHPRDEPIDRARDAEDGGANAGRARLVEERGDQIIQAVEVERRVFADDPRFRP